MVTALQIGLLLVLIALIGIILGYLFGKLSCKKKANDLCFNKSDYCESQSLASINESENSNDEKPSILSSTNVATADENRVESNTETENVVNDEPQGLITQNSDYLLSNEAKNSASSADGLALKADSNDKLSSEGQKPSLLSEPRNNKPDNLCRIKGIGFVIEERLHNLGVYHFDQIAAWSEEEILWVDRHLAFSGRIKREDWIGQAQKLASGEETEFSKRVDKGDVSTSRKSTDEEKA